MLDFFKKRLWLALVFAAGLTSQANAGLITETININGGTDFNGTFASFDSSLGQLDSVVFSINIRFAGELLCNDAFACITYDGTRQLAVGFNGFNTRDRFIVDYFQGTLPYSIYTIKTATFAITDFSNWTGTLDAFEVNTSCFWGGCDGGVGNAVLSGNATLQYRYTSVPAPSTSVPEPSSLAIFALGMIGLASRRFKKQS
jgi:hypothetical protein